MELVHLKIGMSWTVQVAGPASVGGSHLLRCRGLLYEDAHGGIGGHRRLGLWRMELG